MWLITLQAEPGSVEYTAARESSSLVSWSYLVRSVHRNNRWRATWVPTAELRFRTVYCEPGSWIWEREDNTMQRNNGPAEVCEKKAHSKKMKLLFARSHGVSNLWLNWKRLTYAESELKQFRRASWLSLRSGVTSRDP